MKRIVIDSRLTQLLTEFEHKIKFITKEKDLKIKIIELKLISLLFQILKIQNLIHQMRTYKNIWSNLVYRVEKSKKPLNLQKVLD